MTGEEVECITVPKKLLEDIYLDYLMFTNVQMSDLNEETLKMNDDSCWKYEDNDKAMEIIERIKYYLEH